MYTKMFLFVWTNSWMYVFESMMLILGGWYGAGGGWKFILTETWANQMCQKVKLFTFTWPQAHKRDGRNAQRSKNRLDKDLSCLYNILISGAKKLFVFISGVMKPSPTVFYNLKLRRCFWIIIWVLWQILFPKSCVCKFITACLDYLSFEF